MKRFIIIILFLFVILPNFSMGRQYDRLLQFDFYGDSIVLEKNDSFSTIPFDFPVSEESIKTFFDRANTAQWQLLVQKLMLYKQQYLLDDWLYYQLIRKVADLISPKTEKFERYTLYKWFLLVKSGFDATVTTGDSKLKLYVQCNENIMEIPYHFRNGKQYVCLNNHDFSENAEERPSQNIKEISIEGADKSFTFKVTRMPDFKPEDYFEKKLVFDYLDNESHFKIKLTDKLQALFNNYPVVDYDICFNTPLSGETYATLLPALRKNIRKMNVKNGVDYLMRFTRYAFLFEVDTEQFGKEKRMLPQQTLLYEKSDCEDRAALFYYLVKEIYNLPMIVLVYPTHVTIGVNFAKPVGKPIEYNGRKYTVCEPTSQKDDLLIGQLAPVVKKQPYKVVFEYNPERKN